MLKKIFYICAFSLVLGQFSAFYKSGGLNLYIFDVAVLIFSLFGALEFLGNKRGFKVPRTYQVFFAFSFLAAVSLALNLYSLTVSQSLTAAFYLIRWVLYLFSATVVYNMINLGQMTRKEFYYAALFSGLFIALAGFVQLAVLPDFTVLNASLGWDPHKNRLASTFFDPNFTGIFLVITISVFFEIYFSRDYKLGFPGYILFLLIPAVALFLTFSRSSWGAVALVVMVLGVFRSKKLLLLAFLLAFLAYFAVPRVQTRISGVTDPADSAHFRLVSWSNALEIFEDHPLFGVGFNTFRFYQKEYDFFDPGGFGGNSGAGSDSSFLLVMATTGIIGSVVFLAGFFGSLYSAYILRKKSVLKLLVLIALLLDSQFINSLFYPQIMFMWLPILTIV